MVLLLSFRSEDDLFLKRELVASILGGEAVVLGVGMAGGV